MLQDISSDQVLSAVLFILTGLLLYYAIQHAPPARARAAVVVALVTVAGAVWLMLRAYAGAPDLVFERAGPIELRHHAGERGYFEYVETA
jgi:hypothetical protein